MIEPVTIGDATLLCGDVMECLMSLPSDSIDCMVTSPPYWGLRDYGVEGMIGLEPTFQEYLAKMVAVMGEVKRVLKPTGTCWVNMGDCYNNNSGYSRASKEYFREGRIGGSADRKACAEFKVKDLLLMPARLAIALQENGWWVRSEIIWAKPNPMPESVTDRPTSAHEKIYLLTKAARYYYDQEAVREPHITDAPNKMRNKANEAYNESYEGGRFSEGSRPEGHPNGRNLRNVWTIATQPYSDWGFSFDEADYADSDGIPYTASRDCPVHGRLWNRRKRQKESDGEQLNLDALRNLGKSCCHEPEQPVELSSTVLNCNSETIVETSHEQNPENIVENKSEVSPQFREDDLADGDGIPVHTNHSSELPKIPGDNSGSLFRDNAPTAISRNKQKNKTGPVLLTSPSCKASGESPSRTEHKLAVSCFNYTCTCRKCQVSHFATFPEKLPRKCIMAGTSERGVCSQCGKPWERVVEKEYEHINNTKPRENSSYTASSRGEVANLKTKTLGWQPTCTCDAGTVPATVLDIFAGSGTTLKVACELGRKAIGIELNPKYIELIRNRIAIPANQLKMF